MNSDIFFQIVLPLKDRLFRTALSIVRDTVEAEDLVQDVLLKLWKKRNDWEMIENLEAYCLRAIKNMALDKVTSHSVQKTESFDNANDNNILDDQTPHSLFIIKESYNLLQKHMNNLPENQKLCFQLREIEGMSYKDISEVLEISEENVKISLYRARRKLKEELEKYDKPNI